MLRVKINDLQCKLLSTDNYICIKLPICKLLFILDCADNAVIILMIDPLLNLAKIASKVALTHHTM